MPDKKESFVEVRVVTTSGSYPEQGYARAPINQPLKVELQHAAKALKITDTTGWVARADGREVDASKSYADHGLAGKVEIDFGPKEGGGGRA